MTVVRITDDNEIIISAIRFIFITRRRYVRLDTDLWYNKDLQQELTDYEMNNLPNEEIMWGKK